MRNTNCFVICSLWNEPSFALYPSPPPVQQYTNFLSNEFLENHEFESTSSPQLENDSKGKLETQQKSKHAPPQPDFLVDFLVQTSDQDSHESTPIVPLPLMETDSIPEPSSKFENKSDVSSHSKVFNLNFKTDVGHSSFPYFSVRFCRASCAFPRGYFCAAFWAVFFLY